MKYFLLLIAAAFTTISCRKHATMLLPVSTADDNVKLQVPEAWRVRKKLPVFGPDCSFCSGIEYSEFFGDAFPGENHVLVQVEILSTKHQRTRPDQSCPFKQKYAKLLDKNPDGITLLDTTYNQQERYSEITYLNSDLSQYLKSIEFADRYRRVTFSFKVANTAALREQIEAVQRTISVNPDFLNTAKL